MKHLRVLLALVAVLSLAVTATVTSRPVHAAGEILTLSINSGSIGQEIGVTGSGFDPGSPATRSINIIFGRYPGTVIDYTSGLYEIVQVHPINADGTFSTSFSVPSILGGGNTFETVSHGTYYVFVTYHLPSGTDTQTILQIASFNVLAGDISISPDSGSAGTEITISGSEFESEEELIVKYDDTSLAIFQGDRYSSSTGTFTDTKIFIPASTAGEHTVIVTGRTSGHQAGATFTVEPTLVIKPSPGAASSTITVSGTGFGSGVNIEVTFNGVSASAGITESNGSFAFSLPPSSFQEGSYTVQAIDGDGNTGQVSYDIFDAAVTMDPPEGSPGWEVTVTGAGFRPSKNITISFQGFGSETNVVTASNENGDFSTVFTVPWGTIGTWDMEITDGHNTKEKEFEVKTSGNIYPITNFSVPGYVGTEVTISGTKFIAGRTVSVTYSGTQVATGTVESDGTFTISFNAPSCSSGAHDIEAGDGTNRIPYAFVMEDTAPPKPLALLPETGTKAKSEAYFDWDDVADPSGVTYTIQIATDASFSLSYIVLEETGIELSEYTVPTQSRLNTVTKEAPYYWRVKAVDKAFNEGEWTEAATFYVGFGMSLPQSAIYIIIVAAAVLLAVFTFWLGRKTAYY